jgi:hypothetical protein
MPTYECIFVCRDNQRRRGRYWLRFYERPERVVAIVGEVVGNLGSSVTQSVTQIGLALVERFELDPTRLIIIDHYPPDTLDRHWGEYNLVLMEWHGNYFASPRWLHQHTLDVREIVSEPVLVDVPFWQRDREAELYLCEVGPRRALISPTTTGQWKAVVTRDARTDTARDEFPTRLEAQSWALDELANAAAEFDLWRVTTH